MGTSWSAQWVVPSWQDESAQLEKEIDSLLARLDREVFSTYAAESELSRLNRQPIGVETPVSSDLLHVLLLAQEVTALTDGAFDVTAGSLVNLWGFGPSAASGDESRTPDEEELAAALVRTGFDKLALDRTAATAVRLADVYIDLSAVAKGYAVDRIAALLEARGHNQYFLEIGGELRISGRKPRFQSWIAALEAPDAGEFNIHAILGNRGEQLGLAGSGNYRNFFELDGVRYSHQIDPRNGRPTRHELAAAYVIDSSTARADALATGLMVMGLAESRDLADRTGQAVFLIFGGEEGDWQHYTSAAFRTYLRER